MNILILGSGGREHALAWAVQQNPKCETLYIAPGNAGTGAQAVNVELNPSDAKQVIAFCAKKEIDLVIIGPEAPLAAGVSDALRHAGILTFGPSQAAAQLEASKHFTKEVCDAAHAPTAGYGHFTDAEAAKAYVRAQGAPIVVKADGLAAGKGVIVAMDVDTALFAIDDMFAGSFGAAGAEVVIEEFMEGEEASLFVICDGTTALPIGTAQDHKRAYDGDEGPNTGGMGAYSPAPVLSDEVQAIAMRDIVEPTLRVMAERGTPFSGILYAGLMIKNGQPRLVEYNVRFGDPECQAIMMRLGAQVLDAIEAAAQGTLDQMQIHWADDHAMTVVLAAKGYPGAYDKGTKIIGARRVPSDVDHMLFHAGTSEVEGDLVASGGRVLNATARGTTLQEARDRAYAMAMSIEWPEGFYRTDIGHRAL